MMTPLARGQQRLKCVEKRWGAEFWIENNEKYCLKLLQIVPPGRCSLHYHRKKDEVFWVLFGECVLEFGKQARVMLPGYFQRIRPGVPHRFTVPNHIGQVCLIAEASTHHDDDDVVRLEDSGVCKLSKAELMKKLRRTMRVSP